MSTTCSFSPMLSVRNEERNRAIFNLVISGHTLEEAGRTFGISYHRVSQIVSKIKRRIEQRYGIKRFRTIHDMRKEKDLFKSLVDDL